MHTRAYTNTHAHTHAHTVKQDTHDTENAHLLSKKDMHIADLRTAPATQGGMFNRKF